MRDKLARGLNISTNMVKSGRLTALFLVAVFMVSVVTQSAAVYAAAKSNENTSASALYKKSSAPLRVVKTANPASTDNNATTTGKTSVLNQTGQVGDPQAASNSTPPKITPHELVDKRTATSDTHINADGTYTRRQYTASKYYKVDGDWKDIDTTVVEDKNAADATSVIGKLFGHVESLVKSQTTFTIKANDWKARFAPTNDSVGMIRVQQGDNAIAFTPVNGANVTPVIKTSGSGVQSVWYYNVWSGVDIEYIVTADSLKENIILNNKNAANTAAFSVTGGTLVANTTPTTDPTAPEIAYTIEGAGSLGQNFAIAKFIISLNKYGLEANQPITSSVTNNILKISVDKTYLKNLPSDAYPLTIDPTVTRSNFGNRAGGNYMSFKSDGTTCNSSVCNPYAGSVKDSKNIWRVWRGAIMSPYSFMQGKKFISANLHFTQRLGLSTTGDTGNRWQGAAHATCLSYGCVGVQAGWTIVGTSGDLNVTDIYQSRINAGDWGAWLMLLGEEAATTTYKNWDPDNSYVNFTYATYTPTPSITSPVTNQVYVDPQVSITATALGNPNSGTALKYSFCVSTATGCNGVVIGSGDITSNQWTVPDGILQDGNTYYAQVRALDPDGGGGYSGYSTAVPFKIDMRRGKDKTQSYDTAGPVDIDLATGNLSTSNTSHTSSALGGSLGVSLDYNSPMRSRNGLVGEYFTNTNLTGSPALTRVDQNIDFTWGGGAPSAVLPSDNFSSRWTGYFVAPQTGTYTFGINADDQSRITVNNVTTLDNWTGNCCSLIYGSSVSLTAGQSVPIKVEQREFGGAAGARLYVKGAVSEQVIPKTWLQTGARALTQQSGLIGRYYNYNSDKNLDSSSKVNYLTRVDSQLSMDWSGNPVVAGTASDFMVRWTGYITVPTTGTYQFGTNADDGSRIKIDGNSVMDNWTGSCCTLVYGGGVQLSAGTHSITVDLYDSGYGAKMFLYVKGAVAEQVVPSSWLSTGAQVLPNGWKLGIDPDGDLSYDRLTVSGNSNVVLADSTGDTHEYTWTGSGFKPPVNEDGYLVRNADGTYTLNDDDGKTYIFSTAGLLTSVTTPVDDRRPAALQYTYSGSPAKIKQISDGVDSGRNVQVYYSGDSQCGSAPAGFDASTPNNMLCAVITNDGRTTYFYYLQGNLARIVKPGNETTDYQYDTLGRIVAIRDTVANDAVNAGVRANDSTVLTQISYDNLGRASAVTVPAASAGATQQQQTFEYLPGNGTYAGATQEHIVGDAEPNGFSRRVEYDSLFRTTKDTDVTNNSTTQVWHSAKDLLYSSTDATGLMSTTIYDTDDRPTDNYGPAPSGWYTSERTPQPMNVSRIPHTSTAYDEGITGVSTAYMAVTRGSVTLDGQNATTTSLTGAPLLHTNNIGGNAGQLSRNFGQTSPVNGQAVNWGMRLTGKATLAISGNWAFRVVSDGGVRVSVDDKAVLNDWTDGSSRSRTGYYASDGTTTLHRLNIDYYHLTGQDATFTLYITPPGGSETANVTQHIKPDYSLETSNKTYNVATSNGQTTTVTNTINYGSNPELGLAASTTIDSTGLALTATSTYEAQGANGSYLRQTSSSLPGGATTTYTYYGATETKDNPCTPEVESYRQGGMLKLKTEPDPDGTDPQTGRTIETIYDDSGKVVATRYNSDPWTCTTYDAREQISQTIVPAYNSQAARTVTNLYAVNGNPLITSSTDENGTILVETDLLGRNVRYIDAKGNITTSEYDTKGRLVKRTSGLGVETFVYDNVNRLTDQKLDDVTLATASYDAYSRLASVQYQTGLHLDLTRESTTTGLGRLIKRTYTTSTEQTLSDEVVRAVNGDVISGTELGQAKNYSYDTAGRLTAATVAGNTFTYGYDTQDSSCSALAGANANAGKDSNRTSQIVNGVTTTYCYDQADRLIASSNALYDAPVYDAHGNTMSLGSGATKTYFTYDSSDRNVGITETNDIGSVTTTYARDVQGRLFYRHHDTNGSNVSDDYYGYTASGDSPDFITDLDGNVTEKYFTLAGGILLTIRPQRTSAGARTYSLPNIHGDTMAAIDADGMVTNQTMTGPFGEKLPDQPHAWNTLNEATFGYVGAVRKLSETGTALRPVQMGARVYIPSLGRFLQVDPVQGGTPNPYVYPPDPVNGYDLDGNNGILLKLLTKLLVKESAKKVVKKQVTKQATKQVIKQQIKTSPSTVRSSSVATKSYSQTPAQRAIVGSRQSPVLTRAKQPQFNNAPEVINGRRYTGHSLDAMQNTGMRPSVVENTIRFGQKSEGYLGRNRYYDPNNNLTVITEQSGDVITTFPGGF